jgi:pseudooxynicotine oxidase
MMTKNRREFLRLAGASTLGLATAAVISRANSVAAVERDGSNSDVVIIGGGFAGVTSARELGREGLKVVVVEARDRLGGRTFTGKFGTHTTEFGGTWIHWAQPHVWAEVTRYGLNIVETPVNAVQRLSWISGGKLRNASVEEAAPIIVSALKKYDNVDGADGMKLFARPIDSTFSDEYRRYDDQSLTPRLKQCGLTPDEEALMNAWLTGECGNDPAVAGLVDQIRWYRLCDGSFEASNDRLIRYKLKDGTHALIEAMMRDSKAPYQLSTRVAKIEDTSAGVVVHTASGQTLRARAAIVTVPMNTLDRIVFAPALSPAKQAATREKHANRSTKVWYQLKQPVGLWQGLAPWPNPISITFVDHEEPDGPVLVAFGPPGGMNVNDRESVQRAVRTLLPDAVVVKAAGHDWSADKFSDGAWCWYKPNQMTKYLKALQTREGNLFFASADSANGWRGFIDGAVESGLRAAHDVLEAFRS